MDRLYELGVKHGREQSLDEQDKEIEQLKKEKEWLIDRMVGTMYSDTTLNIRRTGLIKRMQQALKE